MDKPVSARPLSTSAISFIKNVKPILINGIWLSGSDPILVENPSTGQSLLTLGQSSDADVDSAVEAARAAFDIEIGRSCERLTELGYCSASRIW